MNLSANEDRGAGGITAARHERLNGESQPPARYDVLDALRFVLALWVAVGHLKSFPFFGETHLSGSVALFARGLDTLVWGPPAVMVFFVISGFCIHYPAVSGKRFPVFSFYARRYSRVLIPLAAAVLLMRVCFGSTHLFSANSVLWNGPLWSLLCEEIYYAIYPAVRWMRDRAGWKSVLVLATTASVLTSVWYHGVREWKDLGPWGTAITLYPVWLLGCVLAEQAADLKPLQKPRTIWGWRLAAWLAMWIAEMMHFHGHIPLTKTLAPDGVLSYFWIRNEIAWYKLRHPPRLLCLGGNWSYSLYLIHPIVIVAIVLHPAWIDTNTRVGWVVSMGLILAASWLFYLMVERPSHRLARKIRFAPDSLPRPRSA